MSDLCLPDDPTVAQVIDAYLKHGKIDALADAGERRRILALFCKAHGALPLSTARPYHLRLWLDAQPSLKSSWTVRGWNIKVQRPFNWAADLGIIARNPFKGVTQEKGERRRAMTEDEFRLCLRHADRIIRPLLCFMAWTGARTGEACAAKWSDVSFDSIESAWVILQQHKTRKKTGKPRIIAAVGPAARLLLWLQRRRRYEGCEHVFYNNRGRPWIRASLHYQIDQMRERAGLPREVVPYMLRHRYATNALADHDVEIKAVSQLLGHSSVRTTEIYLHVEGRKDFLAEAARRALGK